MQCLSNLSARFSQLSAFVFIGCRSLLWNGPLRKHSYSNILKILRPKKENFQIKNSNIFHISAQNIDCGHSLELPLCFVQKYEK